MLTPLPSRTSTESFTRSVAKSTSWIYWTHPAIIRFPPCGASLSSQVSGEPTGNGGPGDWSLAGSGWGWCVVLGVALSAALCLAAVLTFPTRSLIGDVFILVFSLDNRDSFEEVQRLKQQILDTKSCLKNKTKENVDVPLVICGNKGDRDFYREVEQREIEQLVGDDPQRCAYFEISAKKNSSLDQMFRALFAMAKLPSEMSPDLHRKVSVQYCDVLHKKALRNKKLLRAGSGGGGDHGDAFGILAPFARRPSVHSDLMYIREKTNVGSQAKDKERCVIS